MVTKKDNRKRSIKSKLLAAICMLMVSVIMVVSSTYAWFTLSTAPEVTGISTAIGANGNLEMALLPSAYTDVAEALGAIGNADGTISGTALNNTWGNLVNLDDPSYGWDKITLYPSKLATTGNVISSYFLGTPTYGADGRFTGDLGTTASTAIYSGGGFGTQGFGVRGVGTSSGLSDMENAYREALSAANDAFTKAISQAQTAVGTGGSSLATLAVKKATTTNPVYTERDVAAVITAYRALDTALDSIETALIQYVIADHLSSGLSEQQFLAFLPIAESADDFADLAGYISTTAQTYVTKLATMQSEVDTALTALSSVEYTGTTTVTEKDENGADVEVTLNTCDWSDISGHLLALADMDAMLLNNKTIDYYMANNFANISELTSNLKNLTLTVNADHTDTRLYARLADFVDTFSTPVTISGVSYMGITAGDMEATMWVYPSETNPYLPAMKTEARTYAEGAFGTTGGGSITDFYGYIVDMAFRTNAADSSLKLQTDAIDRIYADNEENEYTMGGGSSMTFSIDGVNGFTIEQLKNLMSYIRVVFFNPADNTIYGYAQLDNVVDVETTENSVTMKLRMWDPTANNNNGAWAASDVITALTQNTATAVSALVYLDGEELENKDIANANLTGTMNLQFASTADLVPMEYGDLRDGNETENGDDNENTVTATQMTAVTAPSGYSTAAAFTGNSIAMTIENTDGSETVQVEIGGTTYNALYSSENGIWVVTNVTETLAADTAITVTVTPATANP